MGVPFLNDLAVDGTLNTTNHEVSKSYPNTCVPSIDAICTIFKAVWHDPVGTPTHDLPHERQTH